MSGETGENVMKCGVQADCKKGMLREIIGQGCVLDKLESR